MDAKNWLKVLVVASVMLTVGHCCRHYNLLNTNYLEWMNASVRVGTPQAGPSVKSDSVVPTLDSLPRREGYYELNWGLLAQTQFKPVRVDSLDGLMVLFPSFPSVMKALEGQKVLMRGYVIPVDETGDTQTLVLSANSYTTCFFCGKAGPESIMDVRLRNPESVRHFRQDEQVAFRGTLKLSDTDFDYFNYIIEGAEWVK